MAQPGQPEDVFPIVDFFLIYTRSDQPWAEWIAWQLKVAGYSTFMLQNLVPGENRVLAVEKALKHSQRSLLLLSPDALKDAWLGAQYSSFVHRDPSGAERSLVPVILVPCTLPGTLASLVPLDLHNLTEEEALECLQAFLQNRRVRQPSPPFPGQAPAGPPVAYPRLPTVWNVFPARNSTFIRRETELAMLHTHFQMRRGRAQTISGMPGVGKTQLAVEYAWQHRDEYTYVFWVLADTPEHILYSYYEIAPLLMLQVKEPETLIGVMKQWLRTHRDYLLILDNADNLADSPQFLPSDPAGHILLTRQSSNLERLRQFLNLDQPLHLLPFEPAEGAELLLTCSGRQATGASDDEKMLARKISEELGGLALALDQARAFITSSTIDLADYLSLFQRHHADLLKQPGSGRYPRSIAATLDISFERLEHESPAAAELLRFCAFLAPDAIPKLLLQDGAEEMGPQLATIASHDLYREKAIIALLDYALIERNPQKKTLAMHRLVQAVIRDRMTEEEKQEWRRRAVNAVNAAFPYIEFAHWALCERLLPHAQQCAIWIEQDQIFTIDAARLLNQTGYYLDGRGRYQEAVPFCQRSLAICERELGPMHSLTATSLHNLAVLYYAQGKYREAEPLFKRVVDIRQIELSTSQHNLSTSQHNLSTSQHNLAKVYKALGKQDDAEPLFEEAKKIWELDMEDSFPNATRHLNHLAELYRVQSRYREPEPLYERALIAWEEALEGSHPLTATSLHNLADLYKSEGRYGEAEALYLRALAIRRKMLGNNHPLTATSLHSLAALYRAQGRHTKAEPLLQKALRIRQQELGDNHPDTAQCLANLAELYYVQSKYQEAEPLIRHACEISETVLGPQHPTSRIYKRNYRILQEEGKR